MDDITGQSLDCPLAIVLRHLHLSHFRARKMKFTIDVMATAYLVDGLCTLMARPVESTYLVPYVCRINCHTQAEERKRV